MADGSSSDAETDEDDPWSPRIETNLTYAGRTALAVAYGVDPSPPAPGVTPEADQADGSGFAIRLYVDQETFLPLGHVLDIYDGSTGDSGRSETTIEGTFIPSPTLPATFFSAHVRFFAYPPLPEDSVGDRLIWIGDRVEAGDGFPALELRWIGQRMVANEPTTGQALELWYVPVDDESNSGPVELYVMSADDWESIRSRPETQVRLEGPCVQRTDIALDGGTGTIYSYYEDLPESATEDCPAGPPDTYLPMAQFGDTVVTIIGPSAYVRLLTPDLPVTPGPFDTPDGFEWIIGHLRPLE
jgi:hypothetical protein